MKLQHELGKELDFVKCLIRDAGTMLVEKRRKISGIKKKIDNSLVCNVDKEVSSYLTKELQANFQGYGLLDEENPNDTRHLHRRSWVVDPLDGTIEYIKGGENFGVMIGLMEDYRPILGVVYRPLRNELIYAVKNQGAFTNDGSIISVSPSSKVDLLVSKSRKNPELDEIIQEIQPSQVKEMPSSFKTIEVAKGTGTLFVCPTSATMNLWDLCAPSIILEEAGGRMTDLFGNVHNYAGSTVNSFGVIASNEIVHDEIVRRISKLY